MSVTVSLKNIKSREKFLRRDVDKTLLYVGEILRGKIIKAWLSGTAPDGSSFKKGNSKYLSYKSSKGRRGKIDLNFSGDMQQSFSVKKDGKNAVMLWFKSAAERAKALGNYKIRKNMMKVGNKLNDLIVKKFFNRMTRW